MKIKKSTPKKNKHMEIEAAEQKGRVAKWYQYIRLLEQIKFHLLMYLVNNFPLYIWSDMFSFTMMSSG